MLAASGTISAAWALHADGLVPLTISVPAAILAAVGATVSAHQHTSLYHRRAHEHRARSERALRELVAHARQMRHAMDATAQRVAHGDLTPAPPASSWTSPPVDGFDEVHRLLATTTAEISRVLVDRARQQQAQRATAHLHDELLRVVAYRQLPLMQATLGRLSRVEDLVEDPDLLSELYKIDHLIMQALRRAEGYARLGGQKSAPWKQEPLSVVTALRSAEQECEQYTRVVVAPDCDHLAFHGHVARDLVHLLAELIENATQFSPQTTRVQVKATQIAEGLHILVSDQGLSIPDAKLHRLNAHLAAPGEELLREGLRTGQIGLLVVAVIARRLRIRVQLHSTPHHGNQAHVVVPQALLTPSRAEEPLAPVPGVPLTSPLGPGQLPGPMGAPRATARPQPGSGSPQGPVRAAPAGPYEQPAPHPVPVPRVDPSLPALPRRVRTSPAAAAPARPAPAADGLPQGSLMGAYLQGVRRAQQPPP
ncbi:ATP-binding protein [Streptomyces sp. NPDC001941]|uniref:sensor histidine kinase n=1 Tax=Streptomyces sp. NPDC001941 TaxID=3154659 RepID=UPI003323C3F2